MSMTLALKSLEANVGSEVLPMILNKCVQEFARREEQIASALASADPKALREAAHPVKSVARTVGLIALAESAAKVESLVVDGMGTEALGLGPSLQSSVADGRSQVSTYLTQL